MRILHAVHTFAPDSRGGTEGYVALLAAAQLAAGHAPAVLAGSDAREIPGGFAAERVPVRGGAQAGGEVELPVLRVRAPRRELARVEGLDDAPRAALERALATERPDVVHVHHWHNLSTDLVATCRRAGVPAVVTLHDYFATCPFFFRLPDGRNACPPDLEQETCVRCLGRVAGDAPAVLEDALARRRRHLARELAEARAVVALSRAQRDFLRRYPDFAALDVSVAPLPAPEVERPTAAAERGPERRPDAPLRVVSWGGLEPGKGLGTLLEACRRLPRPESVELHHYGGLLDAGFAAELRATAGPVALTLHGPFDGAAAFGELARHDLAVFPSHYLETHGYAVDEALGLGLPVVVTDRGAPQERVGKRGWVVPAGDAGALAALLGALGADPARLAAARAAAPPAAATWPEHLAILDRLYRSGRMAD